MPTPSQAGELRIAEVARQIAADIRKRGLKPGDAYLKTADCARAMGVSTALTNRAMQLLTLRGLLERSQRAGTTIGPGNRSARRLRNISLIFDLSRLEDRSGMGEEILGIQEVFPAVEVKVVRLPATGSPAAMHKLLQGAASRAMDEGFILWSVSLEVQRLCVESGVPLILRGSPYPSLSGVSHIGWDSFDAGHRLATEALRKNRRALLLLMREEWRPGDHRFIDGVLQAATEAGLRSSDLHLRGVADDTLAVQMEVGRFLERHPHPSASIALMGQTGLLAHDALRAYPQKHQTTLAIADCCFEHPILRRCAHLRYELPHREVGRHAGRLLAGVIQGSLRGAAHFTLATRAVSCG